MTIQDAIVKAITQSKEGYVQHVNRTDVIRINPQGTWDTDPDYIVSDWFDSDSTVVSFENGKEL